MSKMTLKEKAYHHLRKMILSGDLKPGEFLTERTLVEMLNMSRTPIRSALERLDVEELANYTPNKGLVVAEISLKKTIDLYDFRISMECHVVRKLAVRDWHDEEISWFLNNLKDQKQYLSQQNHIKFTEADTQFHRQLAIVHNNEVITNSMEQLHDKLNLLALKVLRKDRNRMEVSYDDHDRIFKHITQGMADDAAHEMEQHLEYGKRILIL